MFNIVCYSESQQCVSAVSAVQNDLVVDAWFEHVYSIPYYTHYASVHSALLYWACYDIITILDISDHHGVSTVIFSTFSIVLSTGSSV